MAILVIAEHDHENINPATRNAVSAASRIGGDVHLLIAGHRCAAAVESAARLSGLARVLVAEDEAYADPSPERMTALVTAHAGAYTHLMAVATSSGKSLMPRIAARLDVAPISEIVEVVSDNTFVRPIYAGNALATVRSADRIKVLTIRSTSFTPVGDGPSVPVDTWETVIAPTESRVIARTLTATGRPELASARIVVSGGRGLGSAENFHALLTPLADRLGAAIGATRAAVDAGFVGNEFQIGQTGKVVAPGLYLAIGLSGAIQHLAGMKGSGVIVAINKDPEAAIFQVADYGLVADLFEVLPALTELLGDPETD
jgi:electron transfer flavoprotein alpha subunit